MVTLDCPQLPPAVSPTELGTVLKLATLFSFFLDIMPKAKQTATKITRKRGGGSNGGGDGVEKRSAEEMVVVHERVRERGGKSHRGMTVREWRMRVI